MTTTACDIIEAVRRSCREDERSILRHNPHLLRQRRDPPGARRLAGRRRCTALRARCAALPEATFEHIESLAVNDALAGVMKVVSEINRYLEQTAPWKRAKAGEEQRIATILYTAMEGLRLASVLLQPVMPERVAELWRRLGWWPPQALYAALSWGQLRPVSLVVVGEPLFPRDVA